MNPATTEDTLALMKTAQATPMPDDVAKYFTAPSNGPTQGLQAYNLSGPAKMFFPVLTPLRNRIPRVGGGFATQANWKVITGINTINQRAGVSQGNRGGAINYTMAEYFAAFRGYGLENYVTFEADYASRTFEDVKALAVTQNMQALMIQEERMILGGNTSQPLGVTPQPTLATSSSGGTIPAGTLSVICVALSLQAYLDVVGINNGSTGPSTTIANAFVPGLITRQNTDGSTDTFGGGSAQKSPAQTIGVSAGQSVTAVVAAVNGAVGYAWFYGAAGAEMLGAVTSVNTVVLTSAAAGTQAASTLPNATDTSTSSLDFDGLLTQAFKPGSNAYIKVMPTTAGVGTSLTSDGAGGIVEFEDVFRRMYDQYRLGGQGAGMEIWCSSQELVNITKKIVANGGAPLLKLNIDATNQGKITAGVVVGSYLNKITGALVPIVVHPDMPAGTMLFCTMALPYPLADVGNIVQMLMRQDYYQIEWPLRTRKYEYGVYADGVLQNFAPFSMAVITNIANG